MGGACARRRRATSPEHDTVITNERFRLTEQARILQRERARLEQERQRLGQERRPFSRRSEERRPPL